MEKLYSKQQIWALLVPLMIEQVLNALMGAADTVMVASVGSAAISAVSLVDSLNILIILVFSAMGVGGSILCAQYLGKEDAGEANETAKQLVFSVTLIASVLAVFCCFFRGPLLRLIFGSVEADVMENAQTYLFITALSYPMIGLYNAGASMFRTCGNSKLPMKVALGCNMVNIAGNAVLIYGCGLGVAGAALATLFSRILNALIVMYFLRFPRQQICISSYLSIRPDFGRILKILSVAVPSGLENGMFQFGKLAIQSSVSTMGTAAIAANAMASTLEAVICYPGIGIGMGLLTIVGQCVGAGRREEAMENTKKLIFYGFISQLLGCFLIYFLVGPITAIAGMEAEAAAMTVTLVHLICLVKPVPWPFAFLLPNGLRGGGDVKFTMITSTLTMWTCRVAITITLIRVFGMGPLAVWIGMFTDWFVRGIIFLLRFLSRKWMKELT